MRRCSQLKCPIATTGVCLEGHTQECPHLLTDLDSPSDGIEPPSALTTFHLAALEPFRFHSGEKLTATEASRMMSSVPAKVVLCAGPQWAGKTTFLARIGEMLRKGSFSSFRFAGSKTLCAFERVTWLATIESGVGQPDTVRTHRVEKDTFFHLKIQPVNGSGGRIDVLITDLPGEIFPTVLSTQEVCEEQLALARADHLVLFVDCKSLIDCAKRHSEKDVAIRFLSQIKKCRHNPKSLQIIVIFSRWDYVSTSENRQRDEADCNLVEQDIKKRFGSAFEALRFNRIAARPADNSPTDDEIQSIFNLWLESSTPEQKTIVIRNHKPARDFCVFGIP
jgi:hypothetical protein